MASGLSTQQQQQQRAPRRWKRLPVSFAFSSARRWPSRRVLGFLARVQFQLSAEQRENVIRRLDIYLATTAEGRAGRDGSSRRKLRNSDGSSGQPRSSRG